MIHVRKQDIPEVIMTQRITDDSKRAASVKDYQMPADEQSLSDCIIVWGRRQIILRGGNRGVEAAVAE